MDYFAGLSAEEAADRAAEEARGARSYARAQHYGWGGAGDGSRSADEMRALEVLDLEPDADFGAAKKAWRWWATEIGGAACRGSGGPSMLIQVVAVDFKKK